MSLDRYFGYLEEIELAIHIHDLLPTMKMPLDSHNIFGLFCDVEASEKESQ